MQASTPANKVSVVIICRNAVRSIDRAIQSALQLTDDVVIIDTGSTDATIDHILRYQVHLYQREWQGYGITKNWGNRLARYPWILSIDADEELDDKLITAIKHADLTDERRVYNMHRLSYLGQKAIRFGEWGRSYIVRLFNRNNARWDTSQVHELLQFAQPPLHFRLPGVLHHYTSPGIKAFRRKLGRYASLMADKYLDKGKQVNDAKILLSPAINFAQNYILKGGFLDGREGWQIAKANAWYTFQKYRLLHHRQKQQKEMQRRQPVISYQQPAVSSRQPATVVE